MSIFYPLDTTHTCVIFSAVQLGAVPCRALPFCLSLFTCSTACLLPTRVQALTRVEFGAALVAVANAKFLRTKSVGSIAEALHRLIVDVIDPQVNYQLLPDPNLFRRACYVESVSQELAVHASSLRCLHSALCEVRSCSWRTRTYAPIAPPTYGQ